MLLASSLDQLVKDIVVASGLQCWLDRLPLFAVLSPLIELFASFHDEHLKDSDGATGRLTAILWGTSSC